MIERKCYCGSNLTAGKLWCSRSCYYTNRSKVKAKRQLCRCECGCGKIPKARRKYYNSDCKKRKHAVDKANRVTSEPTRKCEECGNPLKSYQLSYCSRKCSVASMGKPSNKDARCDTREQRNELFKKAMKGNPISIAALQRMHVTKFYSSGKWFFLDKQI